MSKPNNWREKRARQRDSHNRRPGRAKFWKEKRHKHSRREISRTNKFRTEGKLYTGFHDDKPIIFEDNEPRERLFLTGSTLYEILSEEERRKLDDLKR